MSQLKIRTHRSKNKRGGVLASPCRKMRSHRLCLWPVRGAGSRGWFVVGEIPAAAMQHYALQAHAVSLAVSHTKAFAALRMLIVQRCIFTKT